MGFDLILADTTFWVNRGRMMGLRCLWNSTWMVNWWRYRSAVCQLGIIALSVKPQFVSIQSVNILSLADFVWLSEGLCVVFVMSFFFFLYLCTCEAIIFNLWNPIFLSFLFFFFLGWGGGVSFWHEKRAGRKNTSTHTHTRGGLFEDLFWDATWLSSFFCRLCETIRHAVV